MKTAVLAALAAVCLAASPAWAGSKHKVEMNGPACITAAQAEAVIKAKGGPSTAIRLDGDSAHKLVDAVNRIGEPTSWTADAMIVRFYPDHAVLDMFGPCLIRSVGMPISVLKDAVEKMGKPEGIGV